MAKKLNETQWRELQAQYDKTPQKSDSFGVTGEHWILVAILRRFGYNQSDEWKALDLAGELLSRGY